jgi:hypothetical protein
MVSIKQCFFFLIFLLLGAGNVHATAPATDWNSILNFDGVQSASDLAAYGAAHSVSFDGWGVAWDSEDSELFKRPSGLSTAVIDFAEPVTFGEFEYRLSAVPSLWGGGGVDGSPFLSIAGRKVSYRPYGVVVSAFDSNGELIGRPISLTKVNRPIVFSSWADVVLSKIMFSFAGNYQIPQFLSVDDVTFNRNAVPIPGAAVLLGSAVLGMLGVRRRAQLI